MPSPQRHRNYRIRLALSLIAVVVVAAAAATVIAGRDTASVGAAVTRAADLVAPAAHPEESDGYIASGHEPSVFDTSSPAVTRLEPSLLAALREAAMGARTENIDVVVNSGWRTPRMQQWLFDNAVEEYGSAAEARRWVETANGSQHVQGRAVDIGSFDAAGWFQQNGSRYDLCQVYENESWHYELRPDASENGCPPMYEDAAHDPR